MTIKVLNFLISIPHSPLSQNLVNYLIDSGHLVFIYTKNEENNRKWKNKNKHNLYVLNETELSSYQFDYTIHDDHSHFKENMHRINFSLHLINDIFHITTLLEYNNNTSIICQNEIKIDNKVNDLKYNKDLFVTEITEVFIDTIVYLLRLDNDNLTFDPHFKIQGTLEEFLAYEHSLEDLSTYYKLLENNEDLFLIQDLSGAQNQKFEHAKYVLNLNDKDLNFNSNHLELLTLYLLTLLNSRKNGIYGYDFCSMDFKSSSENSKLSKFIEINSEDTYNNLSKKLDTIANKVMKNRFCCGTFLNTNLKPKVFVSFDSNFNINEYLLHIYYNNNENEIIIQYRTDLYFFEDIKEYINNFLNKIDHFNANVVNLRELLALPQDYLTKYVIDWNGATENFPQTKTINQLIEEQADLFPDNIALIFKDTKLTYKEFNEKANRLADYIKQNYNIKPDTPIGLFLDRSEYMLIAIFAVLKAGGAYVPIELTYPKERIEYILEDTKINLMLTNSIYEEKFNNEKLAGIKILSVDSSELQKQLLTYSFSNLQCEARCTSLAYIIYTSGTTGKPKGVMSEHRGIINLIYALTQKYKLDRDNQEIILQFTNYVFDTSLEQMLFALLNGHALLLIPNGLWFDKYKFYDYLNAHKVTQIEVTPSFSTQYDFSNISTLKRLILGGEVLSKDCYNNIKLNNNIKIMNEYGPTEAAVTSIINIITDNPINNLNNIVPIGSPISNMIAFVLDSNLEVLPLGVIGELYIGGIGLARGYLNKPELTAEKFITNPFQTENEKKLNKNSKLYKTGDLVRWLSDGNLEYIGRNDSQVKIRGYRIELGEIENILSSYEGIKQSIVITKNHTDDEGMVTDNKYIVGYYLSQDKLDEKNVIAYLEKKLPTYMVPSILIHLQELPLTVNGKLDAKALPTPNFITHDNFSAPRNELEEKICQIWESVLGITGNKISTQDDFFKLGGDSILAIKLASKLRHNLEIDIDIKDIFHYKTIQNFYDALFNKPQEQNNEKNLITIPDNQELNTSSIINKFHSSNEIEGVYLANSLQQAFLSIYYDLTRQKVEDPYLIQFIWEYNNSLNVNILKEAWRNAQKKFCSLRLRLALEEELVQIIDKYGVLDWRYIDLSVETDFEKQKEEIKKIQALDWEEPYSLDKGHLFRVYLIKQAESFYTCIFSVHHAIFDGWSCAVLFEYIHNTYIQLQNKQIVPVAIDSSYIEAQKYLQVHQNDNLDYWNQYISRIEKQGSYNILTLRDKKHLKAREDEYGTDIHEEILTITGDMYNSLKEFSKSNSLTINSILQYVWHKVLSIYDNNSQTVVGTLVSGRNLPIVGIEESVGLYVNTLPLAVCHKDQSTKNIVTVIQALQNDINDISNRSTVNLGKLLKGSKSLFDSIFSYENYDSPTDKYQENGLRIDFKGGIQKPDYFISVRVKEINNSIIFNLTFAEHLFNKNRIKDILETTHVLLEQIIQNPELKVGNLTYLTKIQYQQIVHTWNKTEKDYPQHETIHNLFEHQVDLTPDNIALIFEDRKISYKSLNEKANQLGHYLIQNYNIKPGSLIALFLDRSEHMLISMLAVLKIGGVYVPISPDYPDERTKYILKDTNTILILTNDKFENNLHSICEQLILEEQFDQPAQRIINITSIDSNVIQNELEKKSSENLIIPIPSNNLAYVIYTSGTTGTQKGVMIEHKSVVNLVITQRKEIGITNNLKEIKNCLWYTNYVFDVHVWEVYIPILSGHTIHLINNDIRLNLEFLDTYIKENSINIGTFPSAVLDNNTILKLDTLVVGGAKTDQIILDNYKKKGVEVINSYGPTEATVCTNLNHYNYNGATNIGSPLPNIKSYVLDANLIPIPIGAIGELHISGVGLARGYLNKADLTKEKFIANPFQTENEKNDKKYSIWGKNARLYKTGDLVRWLPNGDLEYIGRNDSQVKIMGYRIELGEIENILSSYEGINQSIVIAKEYVSGVSAGNTYLVGYYVAKTKLNEEEIIRYLQKRIPDYMIPTMLVCLDKFPLTVNGKIDEKALPEIDFVKNINYVAPRNKLEEQLCKIWAEVLGIPRNDISIHSHFFRVGGNSITAIQLISKAKANSIELNTKNIYDYPTIEKLASFITNKSNIDEKVDVEELIKNDLKNNLAKTDFLQENYISRDAENILLTGATGFLGQHLLFELLDTTKSNIYCLIRAKDTENAQKKLNAILMNAGYAEYINNPRIVCIKSDLNEPHLGLTKDGIKILDSRIDAIYHCGANVHHLHTYETLREANVLSTLELLKLATSEKIKQFHYISTVGISDPQKDIWKPSDVLQSHVGYVQGKWVCEKILYSYIERNYPVFIYRPGNITGHTKTGFCIPQNNHSLLLLKGFLQEKIAPQWQSPFEMTPVDKLSKAIVNLSLNSHKLTHNIFNLHNSEIITWEQYIRKVSTLINLDIKFVDSEYWRLNVLPSISASNALYPLKHLHLSYGSRSNINAIKDEKTEQYLKELQITYPAKSEYDSLLGLYLTYLSKINFLNIKNYT